MKIYNWDSFDSNFDDYLFRAMNFKKLGFRYEWQYASLEKVLVTKDSVPYLLENMGGGYFTVNNSLAMFTSFQLFQYLLHIGRNENIEAIKIQMQAMPNRFRLLKELMS